jgi:ferritin-like metal-binding protein YciE
MPAVHKARVKQPEKEIIMKVENPKDVFVMLLSNVRRTTERTNSILSELSQVAQEPEIKEALEARVFVSKRTLEKIDEAFRLIGEKPMELTGKLQDVFVEDFRRELAELKSPPVRHIFILSKAIHLTHWRIGEFVALIAAADFTRHFGVGVLIESCLADDLAFVERTRRLLRRLAEVKLAAKVGA